MCQLGSLHAIPEQSKNFRTFRPKKAGNGRAPFLKQMDEFSKTNQTSATRIQKCVSLEVCTQFRNSQKIFVLSGQRRRETDGRRFWSKWMNFQKLTKHLQPAFKNVSAWKFARNSGTVKKFSYFPAKEGGKRTGAVFEANGWIFKN